MATKYYLRLEAVNLGQFVYDTSDLSTTRGGGLLLLEAPQKLAGEDSPFAKLHCVTTGASQGLYWFEAESPEEADELRDEVEKHFRQDEVYQYATFVVDVLPTNEETPQMVQEVWAKNRWRQMQQMNLSIPPMLKDQAQCCEVDLIRPATQSKKMKGKSHKVSGSVIARRKHGNDAKQNFYERETNLPGIGAFVRDFEGLTARHPESRAPDRDDVRQNLHHKMAVIYLDGNKFGAIQKQLSPGELQVFSEDLRKKQRSALEALLKRIQEESKIAGQEREWLGDIYNDDDDSLVGRGYRLETLLWGGDEIIWVVPAWQGWRTLALFYEVSRQWTWNKTRLTHAGGLVFCNYKAPIRRIKELAANLADEAKKQWHPEQPTNEFAYEVLESFDFLGEEGETYRNACLPKESDAESLIVSGEKMDRILQSFQQMEASSEFPRRQLYRLVQQLREGTDAAQKTESLIRAKLNAAGAEGALDQFLHCFKDQNTAWVHLAQLWDYLV